MLFRDVCPKRSTDVPFHKDYTKYRHQLSEDFNHRCGYCNDLDWPRKEHFEIDHFVPKNAMVDLKDNEYSNLVYSCRSCNNAKRAKWPSGDENLSNIDNKGWLDPCSEEYGEQFERTEDGAIIPKTELGKWMYDNLKLGKTQHEYLWNIEQLKIICDALEMKREEHRNDIAFMNKFTDLLLAYKNKIEELGK